MSAWPTSKDGCLLRSASVDTQRLLLQPASVDNLKRLLVTDLPVTFRLLAAACIHLNASLDMAPARHFFSPRQPHFADILRQQLRTEITV